MYAYGGSLLGAGSDQRVGFAKWCDDESPTPVCVQTSSEAMFGWVGFGEAGYSPCELVSVKPPGAEPARNGLAQNVPNPFRRSAGTTIHYSVARADRVAIAIIDAAGRLVREIEQDARIGDNRVTWDCRDQNGRLVSNGAYFYQLRTAGFRSERKMLVVD